MAAGGNMQQVIHHAEAIRLPLIFSDEAGRTPEDNDIRIRERLCQISGCFQRVLELGAQRHICDLSC